MKTLRFTSDTPSYLVDVIRRLHSTYHKRNCYSARSDVHLLVKEVRDLIQNEDTEAKWLGWPKLMKQSLKIGDKVKTNMGQVGIIVRDGLIIFDWMVRFETTSGYTDEPFFEKNLTLYEET